VGLELVHIEPGMDVTGLARHAARQADTIVISGGGDGTVNAVAAGVARTGGTMGVLPLGTLNHFAKDLQIPLDLDQAIALFTQTHRREVDLGEVNGQIFVNNSSIGIYTEVVTTRNWLQKKGWGKWLALMVSSARALVRFRRFTVQLTVDGQKISRRTPILFVGNNEYCMEGTRIGQRERLDGGALFVYLTPGLSRFGMLRIALASLMGRVREVPNFERFCVSELTVTLRRRNVRVSLDGEVRHMRGPFVYRILPSALTVCAPGPE
jgi:diacylglycerol kinase family enzyme